MDQNFNNLLLFLHWSTFCYLVGAIPVGYIIGKVVKQIDITQIGSGGGGTANIIRSLGWFWGIIVMIIDISKAYLVIIIGIGFCEYNHQLFADWQIVIFSLLAILGNSRSLILYFIAKKLKCGKTVATLCGILLAIKPEIAIIGFLFWIVNLAITKISSKGSLLGSFSGIISGLYFYLNSKLSLTYFILIIISVLYVFYLHIPNIKNLIAGKENKLP